MKEVPLHFQHHPEVKSQPFHLELAQKVSNELLGASAREVVEFIGTLKGILINSHENSLKEMEGKAKFHVQELELLRGA